MSIVQLQDKKRIEAFLRRNPELHIYALGDLDDFFWPYTTWYGRQEGGELRNIVLVYSGKALPTVIAEAEQPDGVRALLAEIGSELPGRFHAHLSLGVEGLFQDSHTMRPHGMHYRMALRDGGGVRDFDGPQVVPLGPADLDEALAFYEESYPGNWFDARMLETGRYYGLRDAGRLVSVAGVHVYSRCYRVAALGNIATHPAHRRKGYGTLVTARLCQTLLGEVDHIGLNVKADNEAASRCYQRLGFETVAPYSEFDIERRT
jgi:RimJ/RimL family protein N-acetyltransferase